MTDYKPVSYTHLRFDSSKWGVSYSLWSISKRICSWCDDGNSKGYQFKYINTKFKGQFLSLIHISAIYFIITAAVAIAIGYILANLKTENRHIYAKEGFIIVALSWVVVSLVGALPVSYTHLDVYKRQAISSVSYPKEIQDMATKAASQSMVNDMDKYTDVYKRQALFLASENSNYITGQVIHLSLIHI